ncbi:sorting nexin-8-like [Physella acuta]|uniref:sorting nexin-8-like n=1 Tax=Physella acuta TaxID=109671 RepID=UPI0027DAF69E|nr:sorting nexin-8-like [Physella acuta]
MTADLTFGSIPPFYREVYEIVCPNQEQVDRDLFVQLLVKSSLPKQTILQIWDLVGSQQGLMTRNGLYKALALTALAQQGKSVNDKLLETFSGQELPKPSLGDLSDLKASSLRLRRERTPNVLCFDYKDLCEIDSIKLELVPEKKGIILKHVEYEVTSKRHKATVLRRYNDFVALHELLTTRFPYRIIPRLPPKKVGASREFIEQRKKCLRRYLNIVARHPQMYDDKLVKFFLTFTGNDVQHKIKEQFKGIPDEFMTSDMASKAKDLVPLDTQQQLGTSKEHIRVVYESICKLKEIAEGMVIRSTTFATDMLQFGRQLSILSMDSTPITTWATGTSHTWERLQKGFRLLSVEFASLADKSTQAAVDEEDGLVEKLAFFQDLITAYRDLCERHEKGVLHEHQRAIQKMGQYKKKKLSSQNSETGAIDQLEQKILEQEGQIANMENRNYYSLHCLQMETQLINTHLDIFYEIISCMARVETSTNSDLSRIWASMQPAIATLSPSANNKGDLSPGGSPSIKFPGF